MSIRGKKILEEDDDEFDEEEDDLEEFEGIQDSLDYKKRMKNLE